MVTDNRQTKAPLVKVDFNKSLQQFTLEGGREKEESVTSQPAKKSDSALGPQIGPLQELGPFLARAF